MLKAGGCFVAGLASHPSAERDSLVVRSSFEDRELLLEDAPETYYLTDYYQKYPLVLVRLSQVSEDALRDLLAVSRRMALLKARRPPRSRTRHLAPLLLLALLVAGPATANESNGTAPARALFAQGDAAAKAGKQADAAAAFRKAIDADPDYVDAHQRFIESTQRAERATGTTTPVTRLQPLYDGWAKRFPNRAVYPWALGFMSPEPDKADVFFRKALAIDPAFARAHFLLAKNADIRGEWDAQREHLKAAVASNPDEPRYLLKYAQAVQNSDPARFSKLATEVVRRFPSSQTAAEALYRLADAATGAERRAYFERLRAEYPLATFNYTGTAMYALYDELTNPSDALLIAQEMAKALPTNTSWARRVALQEAMVRAQTLVADRKFSEALDVVAKTTRPSGVHGATWALLKAEAAAGAGQTNVAYTTLVETVAMAPNDRVEAALGKYGTASNKTAPEIEADIWKARDAKATPADAFQLSGSRDGSPVRLADYRGRVVLLAFWFPG